MPLIERLLSIMAPHRCLSCGAEGSLLCSWCRPDAFPPLPGQCYGCQKAAADSTTCGNCRRRSSLRQVWSVTEYEGLAYKLLHYYKFERASAAAPIIARAISDALPYLPENTIIIPVPTATIRVRQRGYDHAELIARQVARHKGIPMVRAASRLTQTRQVGANRKLRKTQLQGAFIVVRPKAIKDKSVIIVDDVTTTGATLEALAAALKQAGVKTVSAAVFAQKH